MFGRTTFKTSTAMAVLAVLVAPRLTVGTSVNMFKKSLDKLWMKEEMYYDFEANIFCTCN